jgi:hypothetical protein
MQRLWVRQLNVCVHWYKAEAIFAALSCTELFGRIIEDLRAYQVKYL